MSWFHGAGCDFQRGGALLDPQVAGIAFFPAFNVFRIDHDEHLAETPHSISAMENWTVDRSNWRYDSGLVSGAVP